MEDTIETACNQYLSFVMADEAYAIPVSKIREVLTVPKLTFVPRMPPFMRGIINVRGSAVPVTDLRKKFGMDETVIGTLTAIIIVEIPCDDRGAGCVRNIGVLADSVRKVITILPGEIEPPPRIGNRISTSFITGMGHTENDFIVILDIGMVLSADELSLLQEANIPDE